MAAILLGARRLRPSERDELTAVLTQLCRAGLGPPLVDLRVKLSRAIGAMGSGRRTVIVSTGLIEAVVLGDLPSHQAAAVVAHAAVLVRERLTRADLLIGCVSTPWRAMRASVRGFSFWGRRLPLAQAAWRTRVVVVVLAAVQAAQAGRAEIGFTITAIGAFSYALPRADRRWHDLLVRHGDTGVVRAGLGDGLVAFLRTSPRDDVTRARLQVLVSSRPQRLALGPVRR